MREQSVHTNESNEFFNYKEEIIKVKENVIFIAIKKEERKNG